MSVEPLVVSAIVEEGNLRKVYQAGINQEDFQIHEEEFMWIEATLDHRLPVNSRIFREKFPDFEWVVSNERLVDLLTELKGERAFTQLHALFDSVDEVLEPQNAIEQAQFVGDMAREIAKNSGVAMDFNMIHGYHSHLVEMKNLRHLRDQHELPGIPTGLKHLDYHYDGLRNGRMLAVLGRPGDAKTFFIEWLSWSAMKANCNVGLFSPEMNEFEHTCRVHTIASAEEKIQKKVGLERCFKNRDLMRAENFNIKKYKEFCEYLTTMPGEITLFTQKYRRERMTVNFIDSKVQDLGLDLVIVDPIYELKPPRQFREDKWSEVNETVMALNMLSETHNIPMVVTNWANRQGPKGDAPHQDSSYGTDTLPQKADHVIGLKHESEHHMLIGRGTKSRFGGNFRVAWDFKPNIGILKDSPRTENDRIDDPEVGELLQAGGE